MANAFDQFDSSSTSSNAFDQFDGQQGFGAKPKSSLIRRVVGDTAISALKGAISVPEAAVGLADIATGGYAGKAAEGLGFRPKEAKQTLNELYSPEQQAANDAVSSADGFVDTAKAAVKNPSVIAQSVIESLPAMGAGGLGARGLVAAAKLSPVIAGSAGEGLVGAGMAAENTRQSTENGLLTAKQSALSAASGVGTAALGAAGGKLAQKLGISDVDTMLAGGAAQASSKGLIKRVVQGGISEGVFEELPQSVQEQILSNAAQDKPLTDGVENAAAMGLLAGAVMGGVGGGAFHGNQPDNVVENPPQQPAAESPKLGLPNYANPTMVVFPDGSTGTQQQADEYIAGLPENERSAAIFKMLNPSAPKSEFDQATEAWDAEIAARKVSAGITKTTSAESPQQNTLINVQDTSINDAATSPLNDLPEPTDAQKEAGNYKLGRTKINGLDISIENPQGSVRRSKADDPNKWETTMQDHYGYIKGVPARAPDKEHVDVYVKSGTPDNFQGNVYVVNQNHPDNGKFDEPKVMIGYASQEEAKAAYMANYTKDWKGFGSIAEVSMSRFKIMLQGKSTFLKPIQPGISSNNTEAYNAKLAKAVSTAGYAADDYRVNKSGVIKPDETIEITKNKNGLVQNSIELAKLPNGKWVAGSNYSESEGGGGTAPSVQSKQYDSKAEAINAEIDSTIKRIKTPALISLWEAQRQKMKVAKVDVKTEVSKPVVSQKDQVVDVNNMMVEFQGKRYPVDSFEDASKKWNQFRESTGAGASELGADPLIYEGDKPVARISYNGKVWPGSEYKEGEVPLYEPIPKKSLNVKTEAKAEPKQNKPAVITSEKVAQEKANDTSKPESIITPDPVRQLVESLTKRRAAAAQINREKTFDLALAAAKDLMNGKPVKAGKFKTWANLLNRDAETSELLKKLEAITKGLKPGKFQYEKLTTEGEAALDALLNEADEVFSAAEIAAITKRANDYVEQNDNPKDWQYDAALNAEMRKAIDEKIQQGGVSQAKQSAGTGTEKGAVKPEQKVAGKSPEPAKQKVKPASKLDERFAANRNVLQAWLPDMDWATIGGRIIRDADENVTGRTSWEPKDYNFDVIRKSVGISFSNMQKAVRKALVGNPLSKLETDAVNALVEFAESVKPIEASDADGFELLSLEEEAALEAIAADMDWMALLESTAADDNILATISARAQNYNDQFNQDVGDYLEQITEYERRNQSQVSQVESGKQGKSAASSIESGEKESIPNAKGKDTPESSSGSAAKDLLGQDTTRAQAIADAERAKDAKRNAGVSDSSDFKLTGSNSEADKAAAAGARDLFADAGNKVVEKIEDLGEKIGGARKDTSSSSGTKSSSTPKAESIPPWRKRFVAMQGTAEVDSPWRIIDTQKNRFAGLSTFKTEAEAEAMIPVVAVADKHFVNTNKEKFEIWRRVTDRKRVKVVDKEFDTRDAAMEYMAKNAQAILEVKTNFGEEVLAKPENVVRSGEEYRQGDVTGDDFMKTFGFRGVEFGNWNNQEERQESMNHAFDGLMDMAAILNIPPKAISLNGDLALAFGARGQGLTGARAHYERDYGVMNLTKMKGAGALAHEWFHALDHYIGRQDGKASSNKIKNERGDTVFDANSREKDYASYGFQLRDSGVREEVRGAFNDLIQGLYRKAEKFVEDTKAAERWVGTTRDELAGQLQKFRDGLARQLDVKFYKRNNKPATAEQLAEVDSYIDRIMNGEFMETERRPNQSNIRKRFPSYRTSNDALDRLGEIYKEVRGRSAFKTDRGGILDSMGGYISRYNTRLQMLADAQNGSEKEKKVLTEFAMNAKSIDQGRATDYWTTNTEMGARAFSAYIEDKVKALGNSSDYLSYGSDNWRYAMLGIKPFPTGEERKAINISFDKLFKTLKTKETDKGTALFSRATSAGGMQKDVAQSIVDKLQKAYPGVPKAIVVDNVGGIPEIKSEIQAVLRQVRANPSSEESIFKMSKLKVDNIEGAYVNGKIYLVAGNIRSEKRLREVFAHEAIGHMTIEYMLDGLKPGTFNKLVNQVNLLDKAGNPYIRSLAKIVNQRQPGLDASSRAQEIIALIAERGDQEKEMTSAVRSLWQRIMDSIKAFAKLVFDADLNDRDVRDLVSMATRQARGEDVHNIKELMYNSWKSAVDNVPELKDVIYNPESSEFEYTDGRPFTAKDSERIATELAGEQNNPYRAGSATQKRAALFNTFLRNNGSEGGRRALGALVDQLSRNGLAPPLKGILYSRSLNPEWEAPKESKLDSIIYALQDKNIDLKRVSQSIKQSLGDIADDINAYLQEELFHGRTAKRTKDFVKQELDPLIEDMRLRGVKMADFEEYLWARHAEERNVQIAKINPDMPDGGSGLKTQEARDYLNKLEPEKKRAYEALAKRVDSINQKSRQVLVDYGLESADTIKAWEGAYKNYVPLMREDMDMGFGNGTGQGFSIKGNATKRATGSNRAVVDILANIAQQREKNIIRGEKNRVSTALLGLAKLNPNKEFWKIDTPPKIKTVNERTNLVEERQDPSFKNRDNVIVARIPDSNGDIVEHFVSFNERDERAMRMARSLKNLDQDQIGELLGTASSITRYFSSINTQYNPIFGVINIARDVQGALLNLSTTELRGKQKQVMANTLSAMKGIYADMRAERSGKKKDGQWSKLWEEFQEEGGQTGYRDMFRNARERAEALEHALDPDWWKKTKWGNAISANGTLSGLQQWLVSKPGKAVFDWLSDYNETLENSVRLSAYKVALDQGMTKQQAASLAKNLTVNFNRKGEMGRQIGALYAFFNASVQGTARIGETLTGPLGKKIVIGGILLGAMQAALLAGAGFDDDEPPEFVRDRSFIIPIIPIGDGKYLTVPMPLGFNVIPGYGRVLTEWALSGFKAPEERFVHLLDMTMDMFNPIGNAGLSMQTLAPTILDPVAALAENKDFSGRPIARKDFNSLDPTPGFTRAKDTASALGKGISYVLNLLSGGTDYKPGAISPTPDQIDYLIGQGFGGVGREAMKVEQTLTSTMTGEDLPSYKIPLLGRFYGDATGQASQSAAFYKNVQDLNMHENEIKGRIRNGEDVSEYKRDNPEFVLIQTAKHQLTTVRALRKRRSELLAKDAPAADIQQIDQRITNQMKLLNDRVKRLQTEA